MGSGEMAMANIAALVLVVLLHTASVHGKLGAPGGPMKLPRGVIDSIKAYENFRSVVAISDIDNDAIFECMSAYEVKFDPLTNEHTYNFVFPSTGQIIPFVGGPGDRPGTITFTIGNDTTPRDCIIYYTDYKDCIVADLEFHGHQCTLWTHRELKDNVPQHCIDHFVDVCGVVPAPHSRDLCPDGEGDY